MPAQRSNRRRQTAHALAAAAVILLVAGLLIGFDVAARPIALWDESRLAVNALEMRERGFGLITTYGFAPDLWNTKPPLLIWLEAGSIDLFGPSEWAVRLPSLLAALATVAMVLGFGWRLTGSVFVGVASAATLLFSPGYFGRHAASTGDYEALLCFFTTAYMLLLFEALHRRRPDGWKVVACGLLIAGACLTKGVAGLVPGVGVAAYVLLRGRFMRLFRTPWYAVAGVVVVVLVAGYYLLRERAAPGYLAAVTSNELGARYVRGMNGHYWGPFYFFEMLGSLFAFGPLYLGMFAAPFLRLPATKSAAFVAYANIAVLAMLIVFSLSRTKIFWYIAPAYPLLSIAFVVVARRILMFLPHGRGWLVQPSQVVTAAAAVWLAGNALNYKLVEAPAQENDAQGHYGLVFAALDRAGVEHVVTLDGGVFNDDNLVDYTPQLRFYTLAWQWRGLDIRAGDPDAPPTLPANAVLVTCDPTLAPDVRALGMPAVNVDGCVAVRSAAT